jgi:hypothetical protein
MTTENVIRTFAASMIIVSVALSAAVTCAGLRPGPAFLNAGSGCDRVRFRHGQPCRLCLGCGDPRQADDGLEPAFGTVLQNKLAAVATRNGARDAKPQARATRLAAA